MTDALWQAKLHARLHDPAEKALALLRDPEGHVGGTTRWLQRELQRASSLTVARLDNDHPGVLHSILFPDGISTGTYQLVQRADAWATAADRPRWPVESVVTPKGETFRLVSQAQVNWALDPLLIHPLTGDQVNLKTVGLSETHLKAIQSSSTDHLRSLISRSPTGTPDWRKTALALWRFAPYLKEKSPSPLGAIWGLLPADPRVPEHSLWDQLDLTSAFAGAFAADPKGEVALLSLSIGPVQSFIETARTTSDLWSGSHLLARLAWEAMKPLCEHLGPDSILFPRLRGVPQVDLWLRDECHLPAVLFQDCDWTHSATDSNPLFAATLPNRFVALVPASQAKEWARKAQERVRTFVQTLGQQVVTRLLKEAGFSPTHGYPAHEQARTQLAEFPEVHWAVVPFSLILPKDQNSPGGLDVSLLSEAMAPFFEIEPKTSKAPGFLSTPAWEVLQKEILWQDKSPFFTPNPGVLYPAIYDLAERVLAAAKTVRPFTQHAEEGWRCSLTAESEWLTTDREQLHWSKSHRTAQGTLWTRIAQQRPAWARKGEHLGALAALKRLWPTLFVESLSKQADIDVTRFVVSTHTMALVGSLEPWLEEGGTISETLQRELHGQLDRAALPRKLARRFHGSAKYPSAQLIPSLLDEVSEQGTESEQQRIEKLIIRELDPPGGRLETYYALLLMDGDRTGAWLSGDDDYSISAQASFHPQLLDKLKDHAPLQKYFTLKRPLSPARHLSLSGALNDFSQHLVSHVVEEEHAGRLIYAGGDDVLAMLPVSDLLPAMLQLRCAYSGVDPGETGAPFQLQHKGEPRLKLEKGFAQLDGRLMQMMGTKATASIGAVIAHHQSPLSAVLRELHRAEERAKQGSTNARDAFTISVLKRSGGALFLPTCHWQLGQDDAPIRCLQALVSALRSPKASRRVAYQIQEWSVGLPSPESMGSAAYQEMLASLLRYQLQRQGIAPHDLARRLAALVPTGRGSKGTCDFLNDFIQVAEFLAREIRSGA